MLKLNFGYFISDEFYLTENNLVKYTGLMFSI